MPKVIDLDISYSKTFLPVFLPFLFDYSYRYNVYWGGRGSGKTKFILQKLFVKSLREKRRVLLMRKTTNKIRHTVWKEILTVIDDFKLKKYMTINLTEFSITSKINGSEFICLGLDDPEKIKGYADISDVFMDEATAFSAEDIELIDGTIRSGKYSLPLQMYFAFNPVSKAKFVYRYFWFDKGVAPPKTFIHHSTYKDNPFIDPDFLERMDALKVRNPRQWRIDAEGLWGSLDKLIFEEGINWRRAEPDEQPPKGLPFMLGLDFGYTHDPSALIAAYMDEPNKRIYVVDEFYEPGKLNNELAQIIAYKGYSKDVIIADGGGLEQKSIEEIKRAGVPRIKAASKTTVIFGIQKLLQYELIIGDKCPNIIVELQNYAWKKDKASGEYINDAIDDYNHCIDALRYSLQCVENKQRIQTISKSAFGL